MSDQIVQTIQTEARQSGQISAQVSEHRVEPSDIQSQVLNRVVSSLGGARAAQQLYASDSNAFGAAVLQATKSLTEQR